MITRSPDQALADHVGRRIAGLQKRYRDDESGAVADLARLRRAVRTAPGSEPAVWSVVFDRWPDELRATSDGPTWAENAAHAAVCLYAIHQQSSRDLDMHKVGTGDRSRLSLGGAVGELARKLGPTAEGAVKRRFDAVVTATDLNEVMHHGRGLVTQLRTAKTPLDYGGFAADLYRLQTPWATDNVRLNWARDYYRSLSRRDSATATDTDPTEGMNS